MPLLWGYLNKKRVSSSGLLTLLIIITILIYYPALDSRFLLDDFYNLLELGQIKENGIAYYIFGGFAGPSGRPLSLLSFALQYQDWPESPAAFKTVNLIIHLLNGVLIWFISWRLVKYAELSESHQKLFVFLVTLLWLIHPMQLSTVLYVVQRMTQLSTLFVLIGILGYLHIRDFFMERYSRVLLIWMSLFVAGGTFLAILCKENGILLPLFILTIEATLLFQTKRSVNWKRWAFVFLLLPLVILLLYFALNFEANLNSYVSRPFTLEQRLLTETGVLLTYLKDLIAPSYGAFTVYHDDYPLSTGVQEPVYTVFTVAGVSLLLFAGILLRKRIPVLSFAILWFFAGHLLESTYLNLELYFEHRNYLPSFGLFFGISWLFIKLLQRFEMKPIIGGVVALFYVLVITVSLLEARLWSQPLLQAEETVRLHPKSVRALVDLGNIYMNMEEYERAIAIYDKVAQLQPQGLYADIQRVNIMHCGQQQQLSDQEWLVIVNKAKTAKNYGLKMVASLDLLVLETVKNQCPLLDTEKIIELVRVMSVNPGFKSINGFLYEFLATLTFHKKDFNYALASIREAIRYAPKPENYLYEIRLLKLLGKEDELKKKINEFKKMVYKDPRRYLAYNKLLESLETY